MEQATQTTAANAGESTAAAEGLNAQRESVKDVAERLSAMVGSATRGQPRPHRENDGYRVAA